MTAYVIALGQAEAALRRRQDWQISRDDGHARKATS
jgi:hypothetical protein